MSEYTEEETEEYTDEELAEYRKAMKKYYIECAIVEGSKIVIYLIIFAALHMLPEYLIALTALFLVRTSGGGLHCKHYCSCLVLSFLLLYGSIYLGLNVLIPNKYALILLIICAWFGYKLVPVVSANRPEPEPEGIIQSKNQTLIILLFFCILACIYPDNKYFNICIWTIYIHIIQLLIAKFLQRRRKRCLIHGDL